MNKKILLVSHYLKAHQLKNSLTLKFHRLMKNSQIQSILYLILIIACFMLTKWAIYYQIWSWHSTKILKKKTSSANYFMMEVKQLQEILSLNLSKLLKKFIMIFYFNKDILNFIFLRISTNTILKLLKIYVNIWKYMGQSQNISRNLII